jgi:hypothetical protein
MKKVVKLTESDLTRIVKQVINERLGVNEDVKILTEFLHKKLENLKPGKYTLTKNDLPNLNELNIFKLIIVIIPRFTNKGYSGKFDVGLSKNTSDGVVGRLEFHAKPSKQTIVHEITHLFQFTKNTNLAKLSRQNLLVSTAKNNLISFNGKITKTEEPIIEKFLDMIYLSDSHEVDARVSEIYSDIERNKEKIKQFDDIINTTNNVDVKNQSEKIKGGFSLEKTIKDSSAMYEANTLINYNIFDEFSKLSDEKTIMFFSLIKHFERDFTHIDKALDRIIVFIKTILKSASININPQSVRILSDDDVLQMMKKYNQRFHSQGDKLKRKLYKLIAY